MGTVFISYSHKDEKWKDRVMTHLGVLESLGKLKLWNDRNIRPGADWLAEIERELDRAVVVIMVITAEFLKSPFITQEEVPRILERRKKDGILVVPLLAEDCAWDKVPKLSALQLHPRDGKALSTMSTAKQNKELADLARFIHDHLDGGTGAGGRTPAPDDISTYRLPVTSGKLFGRDRELKLLDEVWNDGQTHIVTLVAWGGVGKTALVNRWLNGMQGRNYGGAKKVYGWSFYSQGAEEGKQASADEFLQETLEWFGDSEPETGSNVEKGRRLARLVKKQKTLLVLDGLEPLQYPPNEINGMDGRLKDPGMAAFLKELAAASAGCENTRGLCVVTSREKLADLQNRVGFAVKEVKLEHLSLEAGITLLKSLGADTGLQTDFENAVEEFDGHALALTLLGQYVARAHHGDIRRRDKIPKLTKERKQGYHAMRVMAAYEHWLGKSVERDILYIMGLFDRPVEPGTLEALKKDPAIPGVTNHLQNLPEEDWQSALTALREARLLGTENPQKPGTLDCHPLVREHFGERLEEENPEGGQEAHKRLYHHFKDLPEKELPDTLAEMDPLFAAVAHGCKAGLHLEAERQVYYARIQRDGRTNYCCNQLGAFGADLACLSHFFETPWSKPATGLPESVQAVVLSWAGFRLRALGRLREAIQPMKVCLEMFVAQKNWKQAAINASNLSELLLTLGQVEEAVGYGRQSVEYADRSGEWGQKMGKRSTLAGARHQAGQEEAAEKLFLEAETLQKERQPEYSYLYSQRGYKFCDLLLGQGRYGAVLERGRQTLEWAKKYLGLLDVALDHLSLGRARVAEAVIEKKEDFASALDFLNQAVTGLRESGYQYYVPLGLFARAECYRLMKDFDRAADDLEEAREIAELGDMKLHLCDYHLEMGRLCRDRGEKEEARGHFGRAAVLINETGYHRRKVEGYQE